MSAIQSRHLIEKQSGALGSFVLHEPKLNEVMAPPHVPRRVPVS